MKNKLSLKKLSAYAQAERKFFEIDEENKVASVKLRYGKPSDIFEENAEMKVPVFTAAFTEKIRTVFDMLPAKYRIDLKIAFEDSEGRTEEALNEIFFDNIALEYRKIRIKKHRKDFVAYSLIGIGVIFFVAMMLLTRLWETESVLKDIFAYVADIATTVTFWEAMTILVVQNKENRTYLNALAVRFRSVKFEIKGQEEEGENE